MNTIKFNYHGLILEVPYLGSHQCVAMNAQGDIFYVRPRAYHQ